MSGWVEIGLGVFALVTAFVAPWSWIPAVVGVAAVSLAGEGWRRAAAGRWSTLVAVVLGGLAIGYTLGFNVGYGRGMGDPNRDSVPRRGAVEMPVTIASR